MRRLLAVVTLLAIVAVPAVAQVPDNDDPDSFLGDWYLISHNRTHASFYGMRVTVTRVGTTEQYQGTYAGGGAAPPCGVEVGDVVWTMDSTSGELGAPFGGTSLNADCTMRESNWFWSGDTLHWNHLEGDNSTRVAGELVRDDAAVSLQELTGHWQVEDRAPHTGMVVQITGGGIDFQARVVEPVEGTCFTSGDLFADLVFGLPSQPGVEPPLLTFDGRIADGSCELGEGATDVLRLSVAEDGSRELVAGLRGGGWGRFVAVDGPVGPPPPDEDAPQVVQRLAPFAIRGRWEDARFNPFDPQSLSRHGLVDVLLNDIDDPNLATGYVATAANPDGCPTQGTVAWQITDEDDEGYTGVANLYESTPAGCELSETVPLRIDAFRGQLLTYHDTVRVQIGEDLSSDWFRTGVQELIRQERRTGNIAVDFFVWGALRALRDSIAEGGFAQTGEPIRLFLATSAAFPDGLAVSSVSGVARGITVLADPSDQPANSEIVGFVLDELAAEGIEVDEIVVAGGQAAVPDAALPTGADLPPIRRLEGPNRFATAAALSQAFVPGGADTVYVATGANFPDALAGGAAGSVTDSPLLLVDGGRMPAETDPELTRLAPDRIVVLGGTGVIPDTMLTQLQAYAPQVVRAAGPTRFHTATAISADTFPAGTDVVLVVPGGSFQEALLAGSIAWLIDAPLLLTDTRAVPEPLAEELARLGTTSGVLLADEGALERDSVSQLQDLFGTG